MLCNDKKTYEKDYYNQNDLEAQKTTTAKYFFIYFNFSSERFLRKINGYNHDMHKKIATKNVKCSL